MAKDRISFDKHDAELIRKAIKSQGTEGKHGEDHTRIATKIGGYLDIQNGKAPSKLERQEANAKAKKAPAPKKAAKAPKAKPAPKAKAPAKAKAPKAKAPKAPKRFDEE